MNIPLNEKKCYEQLSVINENLIYHIILKAVMLMSEIIFN